MGFICVVCHNPASTDVSQRQALTAAGVDGPWEQTIDMKPHIHKIHSDAYRATQPNYAPWIIDGFGGSVNNFSDVVLPQDVGNCYACHSNPSSGPTYYPGDTLMQAMTTDTGLSKNPADPTTPGNPISTTPTMAARTSCHEASLERFWSASAGMHLALHERCDLNLDYTHAPSYATTVTLVGGLAQVFPRTRPRSTRCTSTSAIAGPPRRRCTCAMRMRDTIRATGRSRESGRRPRRIGSASGAARTNRTSTWSV